MAYRLLLQSKFNRIEKSERVVIADTAENALTVAETSFFHWTVKGIEVFNG